MLRPASAMMCRKIANQQDDDWIGQREKQAPEDRQATGRIGRNDAIQGCKERSFVESEGRARATGQPRCTKR